MHLCYLAVITLCVCVRAGREIGRRPQDVDVAGIFCVCMCACTLPCCTVECERERDFHIAHAAHKHLLSHTSTCRDERVTTSVRMDGGRERREQGNEGWKTCTIPTTCETTSRMNPETRHPPISFRIRSPPVPPFQLPSLHKSPILRGLLPADGEVLESMTFIMADTPSKASVILLYK
jgi:hypothetical protein